MEVPLVEVNGVNRDTLSRRSLRRGRGVGFAEDGQRAVGTAASETLDRTLMDTSLPILDAWETTRQVGAAAVTASLRTLGLTPHAVRTDREEAREKARETGCDGGDTEPGESRWLLSA